MDIVFIQGGDTDKSGNTITALFLKRRVDFDTSGNPYVAGATRSTLSFPSTEKFLAWASKEHNGGRPCVIDGSRVVTAPVPAPVPTEKPAKAAK